MTTEALDTTTRLPRFVPASDIFEIEAGFMILMDMPGVAREDVTMDLKDNEIVVEGVSKYAPAEGSATIHAEFEAGRYVRTYTLTDMVDTGNIKATMREGTLEVFLPKAEASLPKKIAIE